jgi:hypothetical protein
LSVVLCEAVLISIVVGLAEAVQDGGALIVIDWATVPLTLPHASIALHVLVSVTVPAGDPGVVTSLTSWTVADEQASEAVGAVNDGVDAQEMVALTPWPPIVGGVVSTTVMTCVLVAE